MDSLPLENVRIIDFGTVITTPWATSLLAQLGAEVIKIESLKRLDTIRNLASIMADGQQGVNRGLFNTYNMNKKSCTIDLSHPRGADLAKDLVRRSDVVADSFRFGVMEKLGLGYDVFKNVKPDIIMLSVSGPGRTGPDRDYQCYGHSIHAYAGLTALIGYPGGPPRGLGSTLVDPLTGLTGAFAILSALNHHSETGEGQFIDLAMSEMFMAQLPEAFMDYTMNNRVQGCLGNTEDKLVPNTCYPCLGDDKWVAISVTTEDEWRSFRQAIGNPSWALDERFANNNQRCQNQGQLDALIAEWTAQYSPYQAMEILQKAGVAAGPSLDTEEITLDPHLKERGYFIEIDHPEVGRRLLGGRPWKMSTITEDNIQRAPLLGEHNSYVFGELLGLPSAEIATLEAEGIIY